MSSCAAANNPEPGGRLPPSNTVSPPPPPPPFFFFFFSLSLSLPASGCLDQAWPPARFQPRPWSQPSAPSAQAAWLGNSSAARTAWVHYLFLDSLPLPIHVPDFAG